MPKQNVLAVAIALVVSGAMSHKDARKECDRIANELCVHESSELRAELEVMRECVLIYEAQKVAIKDWRKSV